MPLISILLLPFAFDSNLTTIWGIRVPEDAAYPRPMLVRGDASWRSLNGLWQIDTTPSSLANPPFGKELDSSILVPYPIESMLGGVHRMTDSGYAWYRLVLDLSSFGPAGCSVSDIVLLHFEASDYNTTVYLNGQHLGVHSGGYDPFFFDASAALSSRGVTGERGQHELIVGICDTTAATQATGKQAAYAFDEPEGIFYTSTSGLWGTVWTECVPSAAHIADILTTTDPTSGVVHLEVEVSSGAALAAGLNTSLWLTMLPPGLTLEVSVTTSVPCTLGTTASCNSAVIVTKAVPANAAVVSVDIQVPEPLDLWSPTSPHLYGLTLKLVQMHDHPQGPTEIDSAGSYFGLRAISMGHSTDGRAVPLLNGAPLFMIGTLDQGFWPESQYTAPTDEALRSDVQAHKTLGFNMVRKHIKMETRRWYWHCDQLGLLVWQDVPSKHDAAGLGSPVYEAWLDEMIRDVKARRSHPSIVLWVTYNEGWGQPAATPLAGNGQGEVTLGARPEPPHGSRYGENRVVGTPDTSDTQDTPDGADSVRMHADAGVVAKAPLIRWPSFLSDEGTWSTKVVDESTVEHTIATLRALDPTRLINDASGGRGLDYWVGGMHANMTDVHHYSRPEFANDANISGADPNRALVLGEYGGIDYALSGHEWAVGKCQGYTSCATAGPHISRRLLFTGMGRSRKARVGLNAVRK